MVFFAFLFLSSLFPLSIFDLKILLVNGGQNLISDSVTPSCASDLPWHCTDYPCTKSPLWGPCQRAWSIFFASLKMTFHLPPPLFFFLYFFYHLNTGLKTTARKGPMWSGERHFSICLYPQTEALVCLKKLVFKGTAAAPAHISSSHQFPFSPDKQASERTQAKNSPR